ncbi:MAG TPA: cytochrome c oxidase assembly protein [Nitrolancea sp.]|nr:cytochrome c oxidase assembly protein [Nitrolancea sp.]
MALPLLHAGVNHGYWAFAWRADPVLVTLLSAAVVIYLLSYRSASLFGRPVPPGRQVMAFFGGLFVVALALLGPFDHYNGVLFSVHMIQHLLLMLVAAPLIVLGRPVQVILHGLPRRYRRLLLRQTAARRGFRRALAVVTHPASIFALYNGSFVIWHTPRLYQAAVRDEHLHELEHAAFFVTALLFWWVLIDPLPLRKRLSITSAVLLLFATWMASDLLCATISLARDPIYPVYTEAVRPWGLSALADQKIGGGIMWAAGGIFYAAVTVGMLAVPYLKHRAANAGPPQPDVPLG